MKKSIWLILISLTAMVFFIEALTLHCRNLGKMNHLLSVEFTLDALRAQKMPPELYESFCAWADPEFSCYDYFSGYLLTGETRHKQLQRHIRNFQKYQKQEFKKLANSLCAIWEDLQYFPVPTSTVNDRAVVSFSDSWLFERNFGGKRSHEGTDLMAGINERGRYPVVSITNGVVEQVGWLPLGGYRLGIRADHGGYFYYAHLYDYAEDFQPGDDIKAGELLGFMGDSGYGEEGTTGKFDVHLHLGIYVDLPDGTEISINPYAALKYLEKKKLQYAFD